MNDGPKPPDANKPEPRDLDPAPAVEPGFRLDTAKDVFLKFLHIREVSKANHEERIYGIRLSFALTGVANVVHGWSHSTTIGGSYTQIKGPDIRLGAGLMFGFTVANKTEITLGNKFEHIIGAKVSHVTGSKTKLKGSNRLTQDAIELREFLNKNDEYWALKKELQSQLWETIANLEYENSLVEANIAQLKVEFDKAKVDSDTATLKATSLSADIKKLRQQAVQSKTHATATLKVIADAAADFEASANWDGDFGGQLQMMSSLQEFAAAISKLG